MISYLITAHNEHNELRGLLSTLSTNVGSGDEVVVLLDQPNTTSQVMKVVEQMEANFSGAYKVVESKLNDDFAQFKNSGHEFCAQPWIFQLDADEQLETEFIEQLPEILTQSIPDNIDVVHIPRINLVYGMTWDDIKKWRWNVMRLPDTDGTRMVYRQVGSFKQDSPALRFLSDANFILEVISSYEDTDTIKYDLPAINFPDYQSRLYRNKPQVFWEGKVHEQIHQTVKTGIAKLPKKFPYCLLHYKSIKRQQQQNEYYKTLTCR